MIITGWGRASALLKAKPPGPAGPDGFVVDAAGFEPATPAM